MDGAVEYRRTRKLMRSRRAWVRALLYAACTLSVVAWTGCPGMFGGWPERGPFSFVTQIPGGE